MAPPRRSATATSRTVYDRTAFRRTRDLPDPQRGPRPPSCTGATTPRTTRGQTTCRSRSRTNDGHGARSSARPRPSPARSSTRPGREPALVGSSWVILDRAGEPAQTFEPFFSSTHRFEFDRRVGEPTNGGPRPAPARGRPPVPGRSSWEKDRLLGWRQEIWDRNDTVLVDDCRTDPQVGPALRRSWARPGGVRLLAPAPDRREVGNTPADVAAEQEDAAAKATLLAATPAVSLPTRRDDLRLPSPTPVPDGRLTHRPHPTWRADPSRSPTRWAAPWSVRCAASAAPGAAAWTSWGAHWCANSMTPAGG